MSEKDQYAKKAKAKIDEWNADIDKMKAKVDEAEADTTIEYQKQLGVARTQRDEAEAKLKEMRPGQRHVRPVLTELAAHRAGDPCMVPGAREVRWRHAFRKTG